MIISHKYKFIFIKTRKTAGTSIEVALEKYCDVDDIITVVHPEIANHNPRNYKGYGTHIGALDIKNKIGIDIWNNYFKFCFERNPWDKIVSWYWWLNQINNHNLPFKRWCSQSIGKTEGGGFTLPIDWNKYTINDRIAVDYIGKFETLKEDLKHICDRLNIPWDGFLTREKGNARRIKMHYSKYYTPNLIQKISKEFQKEINHFRYIFERI